MESVQKTLKTTMLDMQNNFEQRMASFEADLRTKSSNSDDLVSLREEFAAFKLFTIQTLKNFQSQFSLLTVQIDNIETHARRKMLLLHGVKELQDENVAEVVKNTIKTKLKMDSFDISEIERCHRMGRHQSPEKPRPILVKFQTVQLRANIWSTKSRLKGTGVTVSEFLIRSRHSTFMAAREKYGVSKCWTRDGFVFVMSASGSRHRIQTIEDLNNIASVNPDKRIAKTTVPPRPKRAAVAKK